MEAWKNGLVHDKRTKEVFVLLYNGKGVNSDSKTYRVSSFISIAGRVYGRIVTDHVQRIIELLIGEEQGAFKVEKSACRPEFRTQTGGGNCSREKINLYSISEFKIKSI